MLCNRNGLKGYENGEKSTVDVETEVFGLNYDTIWLDKPVVH